MLDKKTIQLVMQKHYPNQVELTDNVRSVESVFLGLREEPKERRQIAFITSEQDDLNNKGEEMYGINAKVRLFHEGMFVYWSVQS